MRPQQQRRKALSIPAPVIYAWLLKKCIMLHKTEKEREQNCRKIADALSIVPGFNEEQFILSYLELESRKKQLEAFKCGNSDK